LFITNQKRKKKKKKENCKIKEKEKKKEVFARKKKVLKSARARPPAENEKNSC
jgi:hypothetical protein